MTTITNVDGSVAPDFEEVRTEFAQNGKAAVTVRPLLGEYACPCQFESPRPTHGDCRGVAAVRIDKGHFGEVALDGLCAALLYGWPGPIYEGNGECQAIIDEQADGKQRNGCGPLMTGRQRP